MNEIEQHFHVQDIIDEQHYYLVNELVKVVNKIYVSSENYIKEILIR